MDTSLAPNPTIPAYLPEMVRLATIPAAQLLAETKSGLLIVDVENRFVFGSETSPASTARVVEPIANLLKTARAKDIPRFYVSVGYASGVSDSAPWMRRLGATGSDPKRRLIKPAPSAWDSQIPKELAPLPGEVHLTKWRYSAFFETALDALLRGAGVETVVMAGVASYGCIIATFIDAVSRGFFPILCAEGVDGANPAMHKAAMDFMTPNNTLGVDEIVRVWTE